MSVAATTPRFKDNVHEALHDERLQRALVHRPQLHRRAAPPPRERLPEFEALRDSARAIKDHTLANLDLYLEAYERKVTRVGRRGALRSRRGGSERDYPRSVQGARRQGVTKGKSMISEEIGLNAALEAEGIEAIETDLGEYIIQLRGEAPSHIIAPAIHVSADDVEADFRRAHRDLPAERDLSPARAIARRGARDPARQVSLRRHRHHRREFPRSPRPALRSSSPTRATAI